MKEKERFWPLILCITGTQEILFNLFFILLILIPLSTTILDKDFSITYGLSIFSLLLGTIQVIFGFILHKKDKLSLIKANYIYYLSLLGLLLMVLSYSSFWVIVS